MPKEAQFYAASALDFLENLHSQNIIYRNMRNNSFLVDKKGWVYFMDMDFVKKLQQKKSTVSPTTNNLKSIASPLNKKLKNIYGKVFQQIDIRT